MEFKDRLMELRKAKGWSQEELGNKIQVSRQTISKWELGLTTPEMNKLIELSQLFSQSVDYLLGIKEEAAREAFETQPVYIPYKRHYEYRSKKELFGMPLVHINVGDGFHKAKGIVAIGNIATGFLALGGLAFGFISLGGLAFGILAIGAIAFGLASAGGLAFGLLAVGGVSIGILSIGGLALGIYSLGGCAIASNTAYGGYASAHIAIGEVTKGTIEFLRGEVLSAELRQAILTEFPNTWTRIVNLFCILAK